MVIRVSLGFGNLPDDGLLLFATSVLTHLYAVALLAEGAPVSAVVLEGLIQKFEDAKVAQANGGRMETVKRDTAREELMIALKALANYVQGACGTLEVLMECGFYPVSNNRTQVPIPKPMLLRIVNGVSGQSHVTISSDGNARGYGIQVAEVNDNGTIGEFRPEVMGSSSRNIPIDFLTPGKLHAFRGRIMGGSTKFSAWSDTVIQRAG